MGNLEFIDGLGPRGVPPEGMAEVYDQSQGRWIVVPDEDTWQYSGDAMQLTPHQATFEEGES
jgi:hypothetical protein